MTAYTVLIVSGYKTCPVKLSNKLFRIVTTSFKSWLPHGLLKQNNKIISQNYNLHQKCDLLNMISAHHHQMGSNSEGHEAHTSYTMDWEQKSNMIEQTPNLKP